MIEPADVSFPTADVAVLFSVFTHMWPRDTAAYLEGLRKALPVGGKVCASVFFNSQPMQRQREAGHAKYHLDHRVENAVVSNPESPLHRIAVDEPCGMSRSSEPALPKR